MNALKAIREIVQAYEQDCDVEILVVQIECRFCGLAFHLTEAGELYRYRTHFAEQWDTHRPDAIVNGEPMKVVRKL